MIDCIDLGLIDYDKAWQIQEELLAKREKNEIGDRLLLLEHPPVITLGRRDCNEDIKSTDAALADDGIGIIKTNRGGRVTYHGPGQLVGYFICSLGDRGIKQFVNSIEELLIRVLADFGIKGVRDEKYPGVWVNEEKIAAIGLHVSRGITEHGFALNVDCELKHYRHIIPCGIVGRKVTSMKALLGEAPVMSEVKRRITSHIASFPLPCLP